MGEGHGIERKDWRNRTDGRGRHRFDRRVSADRGRTRNHLFQQSGDERGALYCHRAAHQPDASLYPAQRSAAGWGSWQICSETEYRGKCLVIGANRRDLDFGPVRSIRVVGEAKPAPTPSQFKEIGRLTVRDRADRDTLVSSDRSTLFREIRVCSERNTIRIRRAEVQLGNGEWQRLFVPLVLEEGKCSNDIAH